MRSPVLSSAFLVRVAGLILVATALHAAPLQAAPLFKWVDDQWTVGFGGMIQGDADGIRVFGATGDVDQSLFGVRDELAIARARARAFTPGSSAEAEIAFFRKFSLSDHNDLWLVNLHATLFGDNDIAHPNFNKNLGPGDAGAFAAIRLFDENLALVNSFSVNHQLDKEGHESGLDENFMSVLVDSGVYYVQAEFMVFARVTPGPPPGVALADYFSAGRNLTVGTSATPVPEPGTLLLLGSALGALSLLRRARRPTFTTPRGVRGLPTAQAERGPFYANRLYAVNAAKEIAEIEKKKSREKTATPESVPTVFPTPAEKSRVCLESGIRR